MNHLRENNIDYFSHMKRSFYLSINAFKASICFLIHGIYPDILQYNGSRIVFKLSDFLEVNI